jgi:uncharacterized protein (TIGR02271 family)
MENTVIGVYDSYAQAESAMNELLSSGFSRSDVRLNPEASGSEQGIATTTTADEQPREHGIGHFFRSLFGMEEHERHEHHDLYAEAVRRGSCVLAVDADSDEQRERATEIMNRHDPIDIDERSAHWRTQGWTGYDASAPRLNDDEIVRERSTYGTATGVTASETAGGTAATAATQGTASDVARNVSADQRTEGTSTFPVVEEELKIGKRDVQRGGVRVYQRVQEKPVEEAVQLRQEHVKVERHAVDQPASEADIAAFKEGTVELREMAEEPVVSKTAHVVEEVVVGKEVSQETANIKDTVRRTDVEVEQLGADASGASRNTAAGSDFADTSATLDDRDFRSHWRSAYGQAGGRYEDYDAAYRYGANLGGSERFRNYRWPDVEPDVRSDWETRHPESAWDKVKDAVRYGAERVKGHH